ncbi:Spermatogenesis-associated protein 5 [Araneus ventricosus]|uniref:Spermatogenesis-associated protein 5 n=1 Tax=Araneus ventricosus TaxID=182803 RepID=A0A4Y2GC65_ARAVE|nr:Spermatogenesis-associated protein 5 [Araneus ventricosus]
MSRQGCNFRRNASCVRTLTSNLLQVRFKFDASNFAMTSQNQTCCKLTCYLGSSSQSLADRVVKTTGLGIGHYFKLNYKFFFKNLIMKAKKGKKKGKSVSDSCNLSNASDTTDQTLHPDKSSKEDLEIPSHLKVLFEVNSTESKQVLSKNIIFLHPLIIETYRFPRYFIVKAVNNIALCVPIPLKRINKSSAFFPKEDVGFVKGELVKLLPYDEKIKKAHEVSVCFDSKVTIDDDLKDKVLEALMTKRYFCKGMKIKEKYLKEFCITKITSKEHELIKDMSSLNISYIQNESLSVCDTSYSLNESRPAKLLPCNVNESIENKKTEEQSAELDSLFSCLSLSSREDSFLNNPDSHCVTEVQESVLQSEMQEFFTTDFTTSVSIDCDGNDKIASIPSFFQIGGFKKELQYLRLLINEFLNHERNQGIVLAVMLSGPSGIGKTLILEAIPNEYNVPIEEISWADLYARSLPEAKQELHRIFQRVNSRDQCIILIDDFQYLCPKVGDVDSHPISRLLSYLIDNCMADHVVIIATTNTSDYDDSVLSGRSILKEINLKIPNLNDREEILNSLLITKQHNLSDEEVKVIADHSQGFTGRDLSDVLDDAETIQALRTQNEEKYDKTITFLNVKHALKLKKSSVVESSMKIKEVKWSDIGGMKHIKEKLLETIEGPLKYPELYKHYDIPSCRGILLYGPPGCSKTMIAKALATECNLNFISKNVSDIHNKYVGESEKAVEKLFMMARAKSPCIIFLDEIDALVPGRGSSGGSGVEERIVKTFLTEMDGIEELHDVLILAATNRPDRLDKAFLRQGRINYFIYVPLPDTDTREEILRLRMKNRTVSDDFDFKYLASKTKGYSGAEIVQVCNEAAFLLLAEDMECQSPVFTLKHMEKALKTIIPRTTKEMIDFYENFNS